MSKIFICVSLSQFFEIEIENIHAVRYNLTQCCHDVVQLFLCWLCQICETALKLDEKDP